MIIKKKIEIQTLFKYFNDRNFIKTKFKLHLSPRRKFEIFSEVRLPKLLNAMRSVRNLSNKNYYEYTDIYEFETEGAKIIHEDFMKIIATEISEIKDILKLV